MAPSMAAVLRAPRKLCRFSYVLFVFLLFYVLNVVSITVYDRDTLLNIGSSIAQRKPDFEFLNAGGLFTDTASEPFVWNARPRRKKRSRKRGKRAGVLVRLRRRAFRPPLPTILLANVQSLDNKLCELRARISYQRETRECCVICLTETSQASLPDERNTFYARFEAHNTAHTECAPTAAAEEVSPLSLSVADVTRSFKRVNIRKAVGPDGIPGRVLKVCAYQLAGFFTDIFNLSLSLSVVPSCFKKSTIVPIPKKNKITCLNDWRPVALTPIFSKCFEKLIRDHICSVLPASLDPLQFAYRRNRSTDDAIAFTLHTALSHLENKNTYVRMLFVDYSSAFNTIVPATLVEKLQTLGLNRSLCSWILDFLTGRSQVVRMGNNTSSPLILNTGAPQGCVLSPLLYSLCTHDCTATHSSNVIVKFAHDTTVIGLITDNDETAYREEVSTLTKWCQENHLSLNIDKTKELVVDFRRQSREHTPISINKTPVERVNSFKFLGVHITEDLTWSTHTDAVLKKAHQRLFFLRRLRKFGMSPSILRSFYTCTVESILTGCITAWFGNSTAGNRKALQRVVRTARHIVGGELPSLQDIYTRRCIRKARRIIKDSSHPSHRLLSLLPSGRRLRSIRSRTSRLRDSFFPQAIRLMNSQN